MQATGTRRLGTCFLVGGRLLRGGALLAGIVVAAWSVITGLDRLGTAFRTRFYDKEGLMVKPNDFSNVSWYFLQKALLDAMSDRDQDARLQLVLVDRG